MPSLKPAFDKAQAAHHGFSTFWMLVWAVAILDDSQRRREEQRRKRERQAQLQRQPAPRPF